MIAVFRGKKNRRQKEKRKIRTVSGFDSTAKSVSIKRNRQKHIPK